MQNECCGKNVTINVCGCCGGTSNQGPNNGGGVGQWKLIQTFSSMEDTLNLNEIEFEEIMCVAQCGRWLSETFSKDALQIISQSSQPSVIMPAIAISGTYKGNFMIVSVEEMLLKVTLLSPDYALPLYVYYR